MRLLTVCLVFLWFLLFVGFRFGVLVYDLLLYCVLGLLGLLVCLRYCWLFGLVLRCFGLLLLIACGCIIASIKSVALVLFFCCLNACLGVWFAW